MVFGHVSLPKLTGFGAGPSSPIRKGSRFPVLNVATGRSGEQGLQSPGLSSLRLSSPLVRPQSPGSMHTRRAGSSLASIRLAAKAGAEATGGAAAGPHISDQALRLPSPFQMAPSLAAKRERVRARWPSSLRDVEQREVPGTDGPDQGAGAPAPAPGSRAYEEVITQAHEMLIFREEVADPKLVTGQRAAAVRKPLPATAPLVTQPSMSSLSSDSFSTMDDHSPSEERSLGGVWDVARRNIAQPTPLSLAPLPPAVGRHSSIPMLVEVSVPRGAVSEPVSRLSSPRRAASSAGIPRTVSHSRIPRPRLVPPHSQARPAPAPAAAALPTSGMALRRRLHGEETRLQQPPAPPPPSKDCRTSRGEPDDRWPLPKPSAVMPPLGELGEYGRGGRSGAIIPADLDEPMLQGGPVYRSARLTVRPSRMPSRATSPMRPAEASSRATSPIRELGLGSGIHPTDDARPRVQTASMSTQTSDTAADGDATRTATPLAPALPAPPLPSRMASPDVVRMEMSLPPSMGASKASSKAASKPTSPKRISHKARSPAAGSQKPSPRPLAQQRQAQQGLRQRTAAPLAEEGAAGARGLRLSDDAASMLELLRIDLSQPGAVEAAEDGVRDGMALLDHLRQRTRALVPDNDPWAPGEGVMLCRVWQQLRSCASPGSATGGARIQRTPFNGSPAPSNVLSLGEDAEERVAELQQAADALCRLLRLSLCDAADLELAQSVLRDAAAFFGTLREHAAEGGASLPDAWRRLAQL